MRIILHSQTPELLQRTRPVSLILKIDKQVTIMSVSVSVQESFQESRLYDEPSMQPSDEWGNDVAEDDSVPEDERSYDASHAQSYFESRATTYTESHVESTVNKDRMTSLVDYFTELVPTFSVEGSKITDFGQSVVSAASSSVSELTKPEKAKKKTSSSHSRCIIENPESIQDRQDEQLRREGYGDERDDDMTSVEEISQISDLTMDMPTVVTQQTQQRFTATKCSALPTISEANIFQAPPIGPTCHSGVLRGKAHAHCAPTADTSENGMGEQGDFLDFVFELVEDAVCKPRKTSKQERKEVFMEAFNKESERMLKLAEKNGAKGAFKEESSKHSRTSTSHSRTSTGTKKTQDKPKDEECTVDEAPVNEAPMEEVSANEVPVEEAPVEEAQVEEAQVEEPPVEEAPVEEAQVEEAQVEEAQVEEPPVEEASVDEAPEDKIPVDEAPVDEAPMDEAPMDETPMNEIPMDQAPIDEAMEKSIRSVRNSEHSRMKIVDKPPIQPPGFNSAYPLEELTFDWSKMMSLAEKQLKAEERSVCSHDSKMTEISGITETPSMFESVRSMFRSVQLREPEKKETPKLNDEIEEPPRLRAVTPSDFKASPVSTPDTSCSTHQTLPGHQTLPEDVVKELRELQALDSSSFEEEESRFILTSKLLRYMKGKVKNFVPTFEAVDEVEERRPERLFDEVSVASIPSLRSVIQAEPTETNRYVDDETEKEMMIKLVNYVAFFYVFVLWPSGVKRKETPEQSAIRKNMPKNLPKSLLQLVNQK